MKKFQRDSEIIVDQILWEEWDPIGINEHPSARDEYYDYVPRIANLLEAGKKEEDIVFELGQIEMYMIEIYTSKGHRLMVAKKMLERYNKLKSSQQ